MTVRDYLVSMVRTVVPAGVAYVLAHLAATGLDVDTAALELPLTGLVLALYYGAVRAAEQRWPALGVLLGWPAAPHYPSDVVR